MGRTEARVEEPRTRTPERVRGYARCDARTRVFCGACCVADEDGTLGCLLSRTVAAEGELMTEGKVSSLEADLNSDLARRRRPARSHPSDGRTRIKETVQAVVVAVAIGRAEHFVPRDGPPSSGRVVVRAAVPARRHARTRARQPSHKLTQQTHRHNTRRSRWRRPRRGRRGSRGAHVGRPSESDQPSTNGPIDGGSTMTRPSARTLG